MSIEEKIQIIGDSLSNIKGAIINKGVTPSGNITTYASAISSITTGSTINNQNLTVTVNGTYTAGTGYTGLGTVSVNVPSTTPTFANLTVTPSTTAQTLTPTGSVDGYKTVRVSAVTSSIDSDIVAGNIKAGVNILGVNGTVTELVGSTTTITANGTYTPTGSSNGFTSVDVSINVSPTLVTKTITSNGTYAASSDNADGYSSVNVNVPTINNTTLSVTPTTSAQNLSPSSPYTGYSTVNVSAVTSSIDSNITAGNIKNGVVILGVTGTLQEGGTTPTGTYTITANGTYDVTNYANADVNVAGGGGSKYEMSIDSILGDVDANGVLQSPSVDANLDFAGVKSMSSRALEYRFYSNPKVKNVNLSSLTTLSGTYAMQYAFYGCTGLTNVDLSSLTTVSGGDAMQYAFYGCTGLTSVDLSSLTTVSGNNAMSYAFQGCTNLTSVDLSSLTTVSGTSAMQYAFYSCAGLTSVDLSSLTTVSVYNAMYEAFRNCTGLTSVDLSSLTTVSGGNAMYYAFSGCTSLTSVLFTNLETIGTNTSTSNYGQFASCFNNCTNLTSITFPNLEKIYCTGGTTSSYGTFANNNKVQKMYFPKLDTITYGSGASSSNQNAYKNVFYGCSSLTELHFRAANETAIKASPGWSTAWGRGAGNVTIYFDL